MKHFWKRLLSLVLVLAVLTGFGVPAGAKGPQLPGDESRVMTAADYVSADALFDRIHALEETSTQALETQAEQVYRLVSSSRDVVPGTVRYEGTGRVVWQTSDGVACVWSAHLEQLGREAEPADWAPVEEETISYARRGALHGRDVYLVQPYYGIDSSFTRQYQTEGQRIAQVTGGTYTCKQTNAASIDFVAEAIESGAVVIFDSHGDTNYTNGFDPDDHVSGATTSYLLLQTGNGLTSADYAYDWDKDAYHALYGGSSRVGSKTMYYYEVDGTAIANHMKKQSQGGLLWAAICLGMATDGLHRPLMDKGLAVAYGYSQSVTFVGDYLYEEEFFNSLCTGKTVAQGVSAMKSCYGLWDWSTQIAAVYGDPTDKGYSTIEQARRYYAAFPIVVSAQDVYPGHGHVDDLQTVTSTWRLISCEHTNPAVLTGAAEPSCTQDGYTGDLVCPDCGETIETGTVIPALGHSWDEGTRTEPTEDAPGAVVCTCTRCGETEQTEIPALLCPSARFTDISGSKWYHEAVDYALEHGIMNGMSDTVFAPNKVMTRAQLAQLLWNLNGKPEYGAKTPFQDVKTGMWYTDAIVWAYNAGIVNGLSETSFGVNNPITREQVVVMLYRCLKAEPADGDFLSAFSDADLVHAWARDAMNWAVASGYIQGSGSALTPRSSMTRAQAAQFFMNYLESL